MKIALLHFGPTVIAGTVASLALHFDVLWLFIAATITALSWSGIVAAASLIRRGFKGKY